MFCHIRYTGLLYIILLFYIKVSGAYLNPGSQWEDSHLVITVLIFRIFSSVSTENQYLGRTQYIFAVYMYMMHIHIIYVFIIPTSM